jgi:hypothetical protein
MDFDGNTHDKNSLLHKLPTKGPIYRFLLNLCALGASLAHSAIKIKPKFSEGIRKLIPKPS